MSKPGMVRSPVSIITASPTDAVTPGVCGGGQVPVRSLHRQANAKCRIREPHKWVTPRAQGEAGRKNLQHYQLWCEGIPHKVTG